jgi:putative chitinase
VTDAEKVAVILGVITPEQFAVLTPGLAPAKRAAYLEPLVATARQCDINTPRRFAAYLAQLLHESGGLRYFEEIWGPTPAQERYEGRRDLGNTQPGDGKRYKGRGPIQLTGRANYALYGELLGLPLVEQPELVATPAVGFLVAARFWLEKDCNTLADLGTKAAFVTITRRINGGKNGLEDRLARWARAKRLLGV